MITCSEPLPDAARAYIEASPPGDWYLFDMSPLDCCGVPAWKAGFFPGDPAAAGCAMQQGTGYGETAGQAIIGAVAEAYEEIRARLGFAEMKQVAGSYDDLVCKRGRHAIADPLTLCLPAGSPVGRSTPLRWVEARRWFGSDPVLVPIDLAALSSGTLPASYEPFTNLISNGLGAGPTRAWAAAHGLFECLQRDGNGLFFRALDPGVRLVFDDDLDPALKARIDLMDDAGIDLLPKFATDEWGLANLYVVGADRDPGRLRVPIGMTGGGEACDLDRSAALRKAVLEYGHARARKIFTFGPLDLVRSIMPLGYWQRVAPFSARAARDAEPRQVEAFARWMALDGPALRDTLANPVFTVRSTRDFASLPTSVIDTPAAKGEEAARRLAAAGLDPLILDFTAPGAAMHAVRVVVPGLEVETMSYYRIGERGAAKLIARDSPLLVWGQPDAARRPVRLSTEAYERLGGVPLLDTAEVDRQVGELYPLYREPGSHEMAFRIGAA